VRGIRPPTFDLRSGRGEQSRTARSGPRPENVGPARVKARRGHHSVYVVYLRNPTGDGRAGYYVGMTGLTPEERFARHKAGIQAAGVVRRSGVRLVPKLYAHLNPMTYGRALELEGVLAEALRRRGFQVFGGH